MISPWEVPVWKDFVEHVFISSSALKDQTTFTNGPLLTEELASLTLSDTTSSRSVGDEIYLQ